MQFRKKLKIKILITMLCSLVSVSIWTVQAQSYRFQQFNIADGLPVSRVNAMFCDSRGILWIGTHGGSLCTYTHADFSTSILPGDEAGWFVYDIDEDASGKIWIASDRGISTFDGTRLKRIFESDEIGEVKSLKCSFEYLLFTTETGTFQAKILPDVGMRGRIDVVGNEAAVFVSRDSTTQICSSKGIFTFRQGVVLKKSPLPDVNSRIATGLRESDHSFWIVDENGSLYLSESFSNQLIFKTRQSINTIAKADLGQLWLASSDNGLFLLNPLDSTFFPVSSRGDQPSAISDLEIDRHGQLWISTFDEGIFRFTGQPVRRFGSVPELNSARIKSIVQTHEGETLIVTSNKGLGHVNEGTFQRIPIGEAQVNTMFTDRHGITWLGTTGGIWHSRDTLQFERLQIAALETESIKAISKDESGSVWISTESGHLFRIGLTGVFPNLRFAAQNVVKREVIRALHVDKRNKVWFSDQDGLTSYDLQKDKFHQVSPAIRNVTCLSEDAYGNLWIGTSREGIFTTPLYGEQQDFLRMQLPEYLSNLDVRFIQVSGNVIWIGTPSELHQVTFDPELVEFRTARKVSEAEGLPLAELTAISVHAGNTDDILIGTSRGIFKFQSQFTPVMQNPPAVYINAVELFYKDLKQSKYGRTVGPWYGQNDEITLPHHQNHLGFSFGSSPPFGTESRFQWMLEGLDQEWSPLSTAHSVRFSNLDPGTYRMRIKACTIGGSCSEYPGGWLFRIERPFWETWWFRVSALLAICALVYLLIRNRIRFIQRKAEAEKRQLQLEKERIELQQKALQLQMNPHFVFNAMQSIQQQIQESSLREARLNLGRFAKLMRSILQSSRVERIALEDELELLETFVHVENLTRPHPVDFLIDLENGLDSSEIEIPPMMLQPLIENVFKHGIPKTRSGKITIEIREKEDTMHYIMKDDGVGLQECSPASKDHESIALDVIQSRLALLDKAGKFQMKSIVGPEGKIIGTEVHLQIPNQIS